MMRSRLFTFLLLLPFALTAWAQTTRFSLEMTGGAATYLPLGTSGTLTAPGTLTSSPAFGGAAGLGVSYAYMWSSSPSNGWGISLGLNVSFASPGLSAAEQYRDSAMVPTQIWEGGDVPHDYGELQVDYDIRVNSARQYVRQVQLALPVMITGQTDVISWSAGARLLVPFGRGYRQVVDADIDARFPALGGYPVPNEYVTGRLPGTHYSGEMSLPYLSVQIGGKCSYRYVFDSSVAVYAPRRSVSFGVYAFCSVWSSSFRHGDAEHIVSVGTIEPPAPVYVKPVTDVLAVRMLLPLEVGLSVSYDVTTYRYNKRLHHPRHILFRP